MTLLDITLRAVRDRLEYLRGEIETGSISYGEVEELKSLAQYIDKGDVLLLEWAGVKEFNDNIDSGDGMKIASFISKNIFN